MTDDFHKSAPKHDGASGKRNGGASGEAGKKRKQGASADAAKRKQNASADAPQKRKQNASGPTKRDAPAEAEKARPVPDTDDFDEIRWEDFPDDTLDDVRLPIEEAAIGRNRRPFQRPWTIPERLFLLLVLWLALGAALLSTAGHGTGFDAVRRYLRYGSHNSADRIYSYPASSSTRFASIGDTLVVLTDSSLRLLDANGEEVWSQPVRMKSPALSSNGSRVVAWDVGGSELYALNESGPLLSLNASDGPFISARFNKNGWLAVTSAKQGYKGSVRVYNMRMKPVFEFHSSRRFVTDACVLGDNSRVAALALGQEESVFVTNALYYRLNEEDAETACDIPDALALEISQRGENLTAVCDSCVAWLTPSGTVSARYDYGDASLREYDLRGNGFVALYLSRYQSGSMGRIVTVDGDGAEIGSADVMEEIVDISAAGRYVAALYTDRLVVYNLAMEVCASLSGVENAQSVLMRSDGSALLFGASSAQLFLP